MAQQLVNRPKYMRVQSYNDTLAIGVAKSFAEELQLEKQSTVRTWVEDSTIHARKAE